MLHAHYQVDMFLTRKEFRDREIFRVCCKVGPIERVKGDGVEKVARRTILCH